MQINDILNAESMNTDSKFQALLALGADQLALPLGTLRYAQFFQS